MNKPLKKLLICGASLMMIASLSSGILNVSAKRVHHYRPRTHKVYKSHKRVNKRTAQYNNIMKYLRWVKKYDAKHAKPYKSWKLKHLNKYTKGLSRYQRVNVYKFAKSLSSIKPKVRVRKSHRAKNNKRTRKSSHYANQQRMTNIRKRNNHRAKQVTNVKKNTNSTNNASTTSSKNNTSSTQSSQSYDETDGGKYYSWSQLKDALEGPDAGTSDEVDNKIKNTIMHNLNHYNYKQDDYLLSGSNADELSYISPDLFNKVNNAYGFSYGMRKVL